MLFFYFPLFYPFLFVFVHYLLVLFHFFAFILVVSLFGNVIQDSSPLLKMLKQKQNNFTINKTCFIIIHYIYIYVLLRFVF